MKLGDTVILRLWDSSTIEDQHRPACEECYLRAGMIRPGP